MLLHVHSSTNLLKVPTDHVAVNSKQVVLDVKWSWLHYLNNITSVKVVKAKTNVL